MDRVSAARRRIRLTLSGPFALAVLLLVALSGSADAAATFTVNRTGDAADRRIGDDACDASRERGKQCTLRAAIEEANDTPGPDTIAFNIGGTSAVKTISPTRPLPAITEAVIINGYTQPGARANSRAWGNDAVIKVQLSGANVDDRTAGLTVTAADSTIRGLTINGFKKNGILLRGPGATDNEIGGNFIGTSASGEEARRNGGSGVMVQGASGNLVGGTGAAARNVISGNPQGVTVTGARATNNRIEGNFMGTDASGTRGLGAHYGVLITDAPSNLVGGTEAGAGNVISGNAQAAVFIQGGTATDNKVQGNRIGTDASGTRTLGNGSGVFLLAPGNLVGGAEVGARNIISGSGGWGVQVSDSGNRVEGNFIGTDATGTKALGNVGGGLVIQGGSGTVVGGTASGAGNVISGNRDHGISIQLGHTTDNRVEGNRIGTDATGTKALGNRNFGVMIFGASTRSTIGRGNTIAHNTSGGVRIIGSGNRVEGNVIESNGGSGVDLDPLSPAAGYPTNNNTVGGATSAQANVIRDNEGAGVRVRQVAGASSVGNSILSNDIFSNAGLGIDLGSAGGVTPNDPDDPDTGANGLQNFPVITGATRDPNTGVTTVTGTLNSSPGQTHTIQCFLTEAGGDPSGHGEGQRLLDTTTTATGADGDSPAFTCAGTGLAVGDKVSATATNTATGDTSEFSQNVGVTAGP